MNKEAFGEEPGPAWEAYTALLDPSAGFEGKGQKRERKEGSSTTINSWIRHC